MTWQTALAVTANGLTLAGAVLLAIAFFPIRQLVNQLPMGAARSQWNLLKGLIVLFIVGYLAYAALYWHHSSEPVALLVPGIFFLGACFVLLINLLSLHTMRDIRRIAVLERESITDPLMGIFNRRHLEQRLREEVGKAQRRYSPLSLLLLDIDHFKQINDNYGHLAGDLVLCNLAALVLSVARESDVVARYGGEEILIIAPGTTVSAAALLAEQLRQRVADSVLLPPRERTGKTAIKITVSIGVAAVDPWANSIEAMIHHVDEALYRAKRGGRNRVVAEEKGLLPL